MRFSRNFRVKIKKINKILKKKKTIGLKMFMYQNEIGEGDVVTLHNQDQLFIVDSMVDDSFLMIRQNNSDNKDLLKVPRQDCLLKVMNYYNSLNYNFLDEVYYKSHARIPIL